VGKAVLLGFESLDYWNQSYNRRAVENEVKKLDAAGKRELAEQLMSEASSRSRRNRRRGPRAMAVGSGPSKLLVGGFRAADPSFEQYWVRPGWRDGAGDRARTTGSP
jgi:hypothetical protein